MLKKTISALRLSPLTVGIFLIVAGAFLIVLPLKWSLWHGSTHTVVVALGAVLLGAGIAAEVLYLIQEYRGE